jgi:4-amino-4-deoxy-L-arabinose transferase-like glycosyltransferase
VRFVGWPHVAALSIAAAGLYFAGLGWSPPYLSIEEVATVQQAVTVAQTGRDDSGQWLPLYITEGGTDVGGGPHDPMWVYADALLLKLRPFSEALMRAPSAVVGVANVVLMFFVARRLFRSDTLALAAAAILALTPAHFMQSRIGSQQIGPVLFVLIWLLFLARYLESRRPRELMWASAALGLGTYSYIAATVLLPCCFLAMLTGIARHSSSEPGHVNWNLPRRDLWLAFLGFALPLLPMLAWHLAYPERLTQLLDYYTHHGYNEDVAGGANLSSRWIVTRLDLWWNTLNPERLLFVGDSDYRYSTRQVGHLLVPVGALAAIGIVQARRFLRPELRVTATVVLLLGPLPAILAGDPFIKRWLPLLPFFALLATVGLAVLLGSPQRRRQAAAVGLLAAAVVQFTGFLRYYHGAYRSDANFYFAGNIRGAVGEVLAVTDDAACALIDRRVEVPAQWRLYARVSGRSDFARLKIVDVERPDFSPPPSCARTSVVVLEGQVRDNPETGQRLGAAGWQKTSIPEPEGKTIYAVYRRSAG